MKQASAPSRWRAPRCSFPLRVNRVVLTVRCSLPVYPDERTSSEPVGMSQRCTQTEVDEPHSIASSARESIMDDISNPSAFAVLRLIRNSNFVGSSTGKSAAFSPFRSLST